MMNTRHLIGRHKRRWTVMLAYAIGLVLLMPVSPLALAGLCDKKPDHPNCTGGGGDDNRQYDFKVIFGGTDPLLHENSTGEPYELSSVTGGHGNIGPAPVTPTVTLNNLAIAEIGDAEQPCGLSDEYSCWARLEDSNLWKDQLTFRRNVDGEDPILGNVHFFTGFDWLDSYGSVTHYGSKAYGWADLDAHPWDPTDPNFCVPIEVTHVSTLQTSPIIKKRNKQCRESEYFAICEAEETEDQFPWAAGTFWAIIWRAELGDSPPCEF